MTEKAVPDRVKSFRNTESFLSFLTTGALMAVFLQVEKCDIVWEISHLWSYHLYNFNYFYDFYDRYDQVKIIQ